MVLISANEFRVEIRTSRRDRSVATQQMEVISSCGDRETRIEKRRQVELFLNYFNLEEIT